MMSKILNYLKKKGEDHHRFGVKRSEEELKKIRDNHPKTQIVYQYLSDKKLLLQHIPLYVK